MRALRSRLTTTKRLKNAICHSQSFVNYISEDSKTKGLLSARKLVSGKYSNIRNSTFIPNLYKYIFFYSKDYFQLIMRETIPTENAISHLNANVTFHADKENFFELIDTKMGHLIFDQTA